MFSSNTKQIIQRRYQSRALFTLLIGLFLAINTTAQEPPVEPVPEPLQKPNHSMTQAKMAEIIAKLSGDYEGSLNNIQFSYNDVLMALVSDKDNNRMRILAPITSVDNLSDAHLKAAMVSNFHLALDARYAIGKGVLYATFIHPLKELSEEQLRSAVRQVSSLRLTFGTTFTSGELQYGGRNASEEDI